MKTLSRVLAAVAILLAAAVVWLAWVPSDAPEVKTPAPGGYVDRIEYGCVIVVNPDDPTREIPILLADWPAYLKGGHRELGIKRLDELKRKG